MARSVYRDAFAATDRDRPSTSGSESKKELWSNLLDNVSSGRKIPEKKLIVLGGTSDAQKEFLDSLQQDSPGRLRPPDRSRLRKTPIANRFALGYTYQDVYDSDNEDMVARLSAYTLSSPSPAYAPLLARLLTPAAIPNTAVTILLDWAKPWTFVRTLRAWIRLLNTVTHSLPVESKYVLEENTMAWQLARDAALATSMTDANTSMPLGPGEYDEPLGLPLVVVCQNAFAVEALEKERGYRESHFDYILQFLRTVLLKHGAALIYTMPSQPGQLQPLVHSLLGIQKGGIAVTGKEKSERTLKHNVVDRERVLVPPAWDSWGKIRVLREGFDVEGISRAWGVEIQGLPSTKSRQAVITANPDQQSVNDSDNNVASPHGQNFDQQDDGDDDDDDDDDYDQEDMAEFDTTAFLYEQTIQDPHPESSTKPRIEVPCTADQQFFASQLERLEAYRAEDEAAKKAAAARRTASGGTAGLMGNGAGGDDASGTSRAMTEHIGPVQFNVGGIQYDADEVLKRLKERNPAITTTKPPLTPSLSSGPNPSTTPDMKRRQSTRESTPFTPPSASGILSSSSLPPAAAASAAALDANNSRSGINRSNSISKDIPTENLEAYFASLMKKGQRGRAATSAASASSRSVSNSPRPPMPVPLSIPITTTSPPLAPAAEPVVVAPSPPPAESVATPAEPVITPAAEEKVDDASNNVDTESDAGVDDTVAGTEINVDADAGADAQDGKDADDADDVETS